MTDTPVWTGFAGDVPPKAIVEELDPVIVTHTSEQYLRLLARLDVQHGEDAVEDCARFAVIDCGLLRGSAMACRNGHLSWMPHGCGSKRCLRCAAREADRRTGRLHHDLRQILKASRDLSSRWRRLYMAKRPPLAVGRAVFTLAPKHTEGLNEFEDGFPVIADATPLLDRLLSTASSALLASLDLSRSEAVVFATPHPTSSKRPWMMHPHIEAVWIHARFDAENREVEPLEWTGSPGILDREALGDHWREHWPGSNDPNLQYQTRDSDSDRWMNKATGQSLRSLLRYQVRPMHEDVWFSLYHGRAWLLKSNLYEDDEPIANGYADREGGQILKGFEIERGLQRSGGVCFRPGYHRVRRYGILSNRYFSKALGWLADESGLELIPASRMPRAACECSECGEALRILIDPETDRPKLLHHFFDLDIINRGRILAESEVFVAIEDTRLEWEKAWAEAVA